MNDKELINHLQKKNAEYIETIRALKTGWISVNDKLPENNYPVLAYAKGTARNGDTQCVASCHNGFWFIQAESGKLSFPQMQYVVTHWMPLPEPPEEA